MRNRDMPAAPGKFMMPMPEESGAINEFEEVAGYGLTKRELAALGMMRAHRIAHPEATGSYIAPKAAADADALFDELEKEGPADE